MHDHRIALIEAPIQCVLLRACNIDIENLEIFLVRRSGWPVPEDLMLKFFNTESIKAINSITAVPILIKKRLVCKDVTIGSHLGRLNKFLILIALILNYRVTLLDDGLYGIRFHSWIFSVARLFKNLKWLSFFYRESSNNMVSSYCLTSQKFKFHYEDTIFLVLSDYKGLGVSERREKILIKKAMELALEKKMNLIVMPHRRGRFSLYKTMNLSLFSEKVLCFEHWYLESSFTNCMIIAYSSSIWQILEDHRMKTVLVDLGLNNSEWVLERINVGSIIKV